MKISVVIAYHDEKQYIKDCLASLAEQTFQDFEVILVCDGCEAPEEGIPETLNIVTVMQEEKGVAGARNAGIEKTQGEYVVFLDADDYLAEDTLEALAEKAEPETVVYISKTETWYSRKVYQDNGEKLDEQNDTNGDEGEETKVDPENPYEYLIANTKKWQNISTLGLLIPRRLLIENPIRFCEELEYDSDIPVLMEVLAKAPKTVYQEKGTYIKRKHNDFTEKGCHEKSGRGDEELPPGKPVCGQRKRQSISLSFCNVPCDDDFAIYDREQSGREKRDR